MDKQLTEVEIEKILEHLSYADQIDMMAQQLFFNETSVIRQQGINSERIIEALNKIASTNPSASTRSEAIKTLKYLGVTPIAAEYPTISKARDFAIAFFGWFLVGNLIASLYFLLYAAVLGILVLFFLLTLVMIIYMFTQKRNWTGAGLVAAIITNAGVWISLIGLESWSLFIPLPMGIFLLGQ